jgi:Taurine catabolism dioxygenase TauD, TfdA family.
MCITSWPRKDPILSTLCLRIGQSTGKNHQVLRERICKLTLFSFNNPASPYTLRPLLYHQPATSTTPERVLIQYARRYFTGFLAQPRSKDIPPITEAQAEALDALHFLAEEHSAALDFQKGDVQYVNNLSIFHARNGFRDEPGQEYVLVLSHVLLFYGDADGMAVLGVIC